MTTNLKDDLHHWLAGFWNMSPGCHCRKFDWHPWWRHQMETVSALLAICAVTGEFPAQRPMTRSFDVSFDLRLNKRLSKQSWVWWFVTPSSPLWCHYNVDSICFNWAHIAWKACEAQWPLLSPWLWQHRSGCCDLRGSFNTMVTCCVHQKSYFNQFQICHYQ